MKLYNPSFSFLGSFIEKAQHGVNHTITNYLGAFSVLIERLKVTTVIPPSLSEVVLTPTSAIDPGMLSQILETMAILNDKEFLDAISMGKEDVDKGRVHKFSELLAEYGLE